MTLLTTLVRSELGHTHQPTALVPGNPAAVQQTAVAFERFGTALGTAGDGLRRIDAGGWTGNAADQFHSAFHTEPSRWITGGQAFTTAAEALHGYATTMDWAQAQAAEAIARWDQAQADTKRAKAEHTAAVRLAQQQAQASALGGVLLQVPDIPFHDPGETGRQAARDQLNRARAQLAEAGDQAEGVVAQGRDQAPPGPKWWQTAWRLLREYQTGVYEASWDLAKFGWSTSNVRMVVDPTGYGRTVATLAQSAWYGTQHPVEFAKAITDWDTWQNNPARALGHLAPDVAIAIATAGSGGAATRAARSVKALDTFDTTRPLDHAIQRLPIRPRPGPTVHPDTVPIQIDQQDYSKLSSSIREELSRFRPNRQHPPPCNRNSGP